MENPHHKSLYISETRDQRLTYNSELKGSFQRLRTKDLEGDRHVTGVLYTFLYHRFHQVSR